MREEPATHRHDDDAQEEQLIPDEQRRENHQSTATGRNRKACCHATDDGPQWRIKQRHEAEDEKTDANPHNSLQTGELCAEFSRRVLLRRSHYSSGPLRYTRLLSSWCSQDD